jgi:glucan phosphoethanolaminetransferase (alkaline phosphatase superfamily)
MIPVLILVGIVLTAIIVFKVGYKDDFSTAFFAIAILCGIILIGLLGAIIVGQTTNTFFEEHAELNMKIGLMDQSSVAERVMLQVKIIEHNKKLYAYYEKVKSPWSNWFYKKSLLNLELIPYQIFER